MRNNARTSRPGLPARLLELDGIRGIACLVVLVHHAFLVIPEMCNVAAHPGYAPQTWGSWILTRTPAHLLWAGYEAVLLFFVLSGISLAYPIARRISSNKNYSWVAYYPRRVIRLYVPSAAGVAFALVTAIWVPRVRDSRITGWAFGHESKVTLHSIISNFTFRSNGYNSAMWSIYAEFIFSLILPLALIIVALAVRIHLAPVLVGVVLCFTSETVIQQYYFLPVFLIGAVIGWTWGINRARSLNVPHSNLIAFILLAIVCFRWYLPVEGAHDRAWTTPVTILVIAAFISFVVLTGVWTRFLGSRPVQWLGKISFSLYAVHDPIVVTTRYLTVEYAPLVTLMIAAPISIFVATLVCRFIEQPSHRLAKRCGARCEEIWTRLQHSRVPYQPRHARHF